MIVGIGTDIVTVSRMQESLQRIGNKFAQRLLTEFEYQQFEEKNNGAQYLAKRFACKEAAVKALGTGFAQGITWKHVEVSNDELGAPILTLSGPALDRAETLGVTKVHLSLSDEKEHAVAFVILESYK